MNLTGTRVFVLDGHEVARRGLCELLERDGDITVVGGASLAEEAKRRIPATRPDVVVVDARLPDGSGVDVCREVRRADDSIAVLVLASNQDDQILFDAIEAGASGFLLKQIRGADLVQAVRSVAAGASLLDPKVTGAVLARLRGGPERPRELEVLTERERRILELIGEGMTNREIAMCIHLAEKTVKNYVTRILAKLGLKRRTQAAVLASRLFR